MRMFLLTIQAALGLAIATVATCLETSEGDGVLGRVVDLLEFPDVFSAEFTVQVNQFEVAKSAVEGAELHFVEARNFCPGVTRTRNGEEIIHSSPVPVCVVLAGLPTGTQERTEAWAKKGYRYLCRVTPTWIGKDNVKRTSHPEFVAGTAKGDIVSWSESSSELIYYRKSSDYAFEVNSGAGLTINQAFTRAKIAVQLATEQGAWKNSKSSSLALVDVSRPIDLGRFAEITIDNGFKDTPGYFELKATSLGDDLFLTLSWRDCLNKMVLREEWSWRGGSVIPAEYTHQSFMVGTDSIYRELSVQTQDYSSRVSEDALAWRPMARATVVDQRFGTRLQYEIKEDGTIPSDSEVIALADSLDVGGRVARIQGSPNQHVESETLRQQRFIEGLSDRGESDARNNRYWFSSILGAVCMAALFGLFIITRKT